MRNNSNHRATVTGLLLIVHFAIVGFTSFSAILLGIHHADSGFDALRIIFGVLAADLVLLACAEGIRHGVFHGFQKLVAKVFYIIAFVDVCAAVYAEAHPEFTAFYLGTVLPISGPVMGFAAFILLASYLDIKVSNRAKGYELALSLDTERAELERQKLELSRGRLERREARRLHKQYRQALRKAIKPGAIAEQAQPGAKRVLKMLGSSHAETGVSGDGVPGAVEVKPVK